MKILERIKSQTGWKACGLAAFFGATLTLALAPLYWIPFAFVGFSGFYILLQPSLSLKRAFALGWFFGLGHFVTGLYWIAFSLGVDLNQFWWLIPFTVLGLPALFSFYPALAALLIVATRATEISRWLIFSVLWLLSEWLRGTLFTGFPWNLLGYIWMPVEGILQITAFIGIYGLSLLTILFLTAPALLAEQKKSPTLILTILMGMIGTAGYVRLEKHPTEFVPDIQLRLLQPNISQKEKWDKQHIETHFQQLLRLCRLPSQKPITHFIGCESAVPFDLIFDSWHRYELASVIPFNGAFLLGTPRAEKKGDGYELWNSFEVVNAAGQVVAYYDKHHLVPFGEYIPYRKWMPSKIKKITKGDIEYGVGAGVETLQIENLPPFSPLICYEVIFPGEVALKGAQRPQWLLTITNDAWFGQTSGPYQHFAMSRVRAIEEGLPLVRVANTGISGVVDAYGRIQATLRLGEEGVLDMQLPRPIPEETFYARYGERPLWILLLLLSCGAFVLHRRK